MSKRSLTLAVLLALGLAVTAIAQQPRVQPLGDPNPGRPVDPALNPVPTDSFLFVSVKASKLWDNPAAKPLRDWVASQKDEPFGTMIGIPAADVDRVTLFVPTADDRRPVPVVLVTTRKPYNEAKVLKNVAASQPDDRRHRGTFGRIAEIEGPFHWLAFLDDRTLLFVPDGLGEDGGVSLTAQLIARKSDGPLAAALVDAQAHDFTLALDIHGLGEMLAANRADREKELVPFLVLLKAKTATLTADFDKTAKGKLVMTFPDAATAKRAAPVLEEGMKTVVELLANQELARNDPIQKSMVAWGFSVLKNAKVTTDGANVVASADVPFADDLGKLVAALPKSISVARANSRAMNNLKQLALANMNFESAMGYMPGDTFIGGDKPPVWSWRVQILPYIEQAQLYSQLDMTKSWDDPANLKRLEAMEMPKVFEHPGRPAPKGQTYYRIFMLPKNAKGTDRPLLKEGEHGPRISEITDGTSNTFMIVEAGEAVPWYKPDVLAYDGKLPLPQLGDKELDLFLVAMGDGSVHSLRPSKVGEKTLRALITINGGEVVAVPDK
jgi:Protein of unknown function (DUF1559)